MLSLSLHGEFQRPLTPSLRKPQVVGSYMYVTGEMDLLGKTVRQIRFAWIDQAKWTRNYFLSYLFV